MKMYKIFKNSLEKYEAVKQGWSWPAFFFAPLWACFKGMWALGLGFVAVTFLLGMLSVYMFGNLPAIDRAFDVLNIAILVWFGMKGNRLREQNLLRRGYIEAPEIIEAANPSAAVAHYIAIYED